MSDHYRVAQIDARASVVAFQKRIEWTPTASKQETKRNGRRERMLARLQAGPATTWELMQIGGAGFSSRLNELRRAGHNIPAPEMREDFAIYHIEEPV
jgi:hypothetical protein